MDGWLKAALPGRDLANSILTNSVDGLARAWSDALVHILQTFEYRGPSSAKIRDWTDRW